MVFRPDVLSKVAFLPLPDRASNHDLMTGGWVRLYSPELGVVETVVGYGSDKISATVARSDPDFMGLVGLPVLRMGEYGGNSSEFWFRNLPS